MTHHSSLAADRENKMKMNTSEDGGRSKGDRTAGAAASAGAMGDTQQAPAVEVRSPRTPSAPAPAAAAADRDISGVVLQQRMKDGAGSKGISTTVNNDDIEQLAKAHQALQRRRRSGRDDDAAAAVAAARSRRRRNIKKDATTTIPNSVPSPSVTVAKTEGATPEETFQTKNYPKKTDLTVKDNLEEAASSSSSQQQQQLQQQSACNQQQEETEVQQKQSISITKEDDDDDDDDEDVDGEDEDDCRCRSFGGAMVGQRDLRDDCC